MRKIKFIATMLIYNFFISIIINDLSISSTGTPIPDTPDGLEFNLTFLQDIFKTFGEMLTFSVTGIPNWIIVLCFYIPNVVLLLAILGFILNRD